MSREIEWAQRIAVLELEVRSTKDALSDVNKKLDELLQLRSKGVGAFWLASTLLGTGLVGAVTVFINWARAY